MVNLVINNIQKIQNSILYFDERYCIDCWEDKWKDIEARETSFLKRLRNLRITQNKT